MGHCAESNRAAAAPDADRGLTRELTARALRHSLWLALFHAQQLRWHDLAHRLTATLVEVDLLVRDIEAAP